MIEPLETRIAPATFVNSTTVIFTDVDGDDVTIKITKGSFDPGLTELTFATVAPGRQQLQTIDLSDAEFAGSNLTVTAKRSATNGGDGFVNVGFINARDGVGNIDLGVVIIDGDLGAINVGEGTGTAVKSLSVQSIYALGAITGAPLYTSGFYGDLGSLKVTGDIVGGYLSISNGANLGSATIGGSIRGGTAAKSGAIYAEGDLGPILVKGSVVGGAGAYSGSIGAGRDVGNVTILGSLLGGTQDDSGTIYSGFLGTGDMGAIKIVGDVRGGKFTDSSLARDTGVIESAGEIASVTIGGSLLQNLGLAQSGRISSGGDVGAVKIGGDVAAGDVSAPGGVIVLRGTVASLTIGGSVRGGSGDQSGLIAAGPIKTVQVRGDVVGGSGNFCGVLTFEAVGSITIGGTLVGGDDPNPADATTRAANSGQILAVSLATLKIGHGIQGGSGSASGRVSVGDSTVPTSFTIGGGISGGGGSFSGSMAFSGKIARGVIVGDVTGSSESDAVGNYSGMVSADGSIGSLKITGSLIGGDRASFTGYVYSGGELGKLTIGGDLRGGTGPRGVGPAVTDTGTIQAGRIGSITIGGSIISGALVGDAPLRSGSIHAVQDIGSITVKGSLIGSAQVPVLITASGQATPGASGDIAIKSLSIGGSATFADVLAGYDRTFQATNSDAQIGSIKVGGNWTAGYVIAGVDPADQIVGNGNDFRLSTNDDPELISKIASITIGGQVLAQPGTNNTFGFTAEHVVAMKVGGVAVPLLAGARNDIFSGVLADNKARPLGASLSNLTVDGFAMHVFEV